MHHIDSTDGAASSNLSHRLLPFVSTMEHKNLRFFKNFCVLVYHKAFNFFSRINIFCDFCGKILFGS